MRTKRSGRTTDKGMPEIPINSFATTLFIPAFVNHNHWVLCVAKRDEANRFLDSIEWYNSMSTSDASALDVVKSVKMVLEWIDEDPASPITGVAWTIQKCNSGAQQDSSSCGPFIAANATAVAQGLIPVPKHVDGVRHQTASVMLDGARKLPIDWISFKNMLVAIGPVPDAPKGKPKGKPEGDTKGQESIEDKDEN